jgi:hypothetical protein
MTLSATIDVYGARLLFETNSQEYFSDFIREYGSHRAAGGDAQGRITVVEAEGQDFEPPREAVRVTMQFPDNSTWVRSGMIFFIEKGRSRVRVDPSSRQMEVGVAPGANMADKLRYLSKRLLVKLLEDRGFSWLHGSSATSSSGVLAFTGVSGSGKTTCLLTMLEAGYRMVADDVVLFKGGLVHPFRMRSMIHRSTIERFASLKPLASADTRWVSGADGTWADLGDIYAVGQSPVPPKAIFNTYVWNSEISSCKPCPPAKALPKLIKNYVLESGGIYEPSTEDVKGAFSAYSQILEKTPFFDLYVGRDTKSLRETIEGAIR